MSLVIISKIAFVNHSNFASDKKVVINKVVSSKISQQLFLTLSLNIFIVLESVKVIIELLFISHLL